jgi:type I restriction enzyme S subunit
MADPVARSTIVANDFPEYVIVADCVKMTPDLGLVDLRYLVWAINSDCVRINAELVSTGTTRVRISLGDLQKLKIPYPPGDEQRAIARFLDHETVKIDALIEKQQRLVELLKEKRQAVISHAVTKGLNPNAPMKDSGVEWLGEVPAHWLVTQLKFNTLEMQTGPFGSQLHAEDYVDGGIPLINPAHMIDGNIIPDSKVTVDEATRERLSRHILKAGELIFARRGELGRCAVVTATEDGWLCGTGSLKAKLNDRLIPEYSYLLITSEGVVSELSL